MEEPVRLYSKPRRKGTSTFEEMENKIKHSKTAVPFPRFVGIYNFESGKYFDKGIQKCKQKNSRVPGPSILFGEYESVLKVDSLEGKTSLFVTGPNKERRFNFLLQRLMRAYSNQRKNLPQKKKFQESGLRLFSCFIHKKISSACFQSQSAHRRRRYLPGKHQFAFFRKLKSPSPNFVSGPL